MATPAQEWKLSDSLINIDLKPTVMAELEAEVQLDERGKPTVIRTAPTRWNAVLGRLAGKGRLVIYIARWKAKRSSAQNRYLWGVVYRAILDGLRELAVEAGEQCPFSTPEELHEAMKYMILGTSVIQIPGTDQTIDMPASTTKLNSEQFAAYIEFISRWAAKLGIYVPHPGEEEYA